MSPKSALNFAGVFLYKDRVTPYLVSSLKSMNIPVYVHTVNDTEELDMFQNEVGVDEIYTDTIAPKK